MRTAKIEIGIASLFVLGVAIYRQVEWLVWVAIAIFVLGIVASLIEIFLDRKEERKMKIVTAQAESEVVGRLSKALAVAYKALNIVCKGENEIDTDEKVITLLQQAEKELNEND